MKKVLIGILATFICILCFPLSAHAEDIVQLSSTYTYEEMLEDISLLANTYPEYISVKSAGTTSQGRNIPLIILGNPDAKHAIMVQATMHAREYIVTQTSMAIAEYITTLMAGNQIPDIVENVCFYVVPMANPDGVVISQTINSNWKANANGVDLNRQMNVNWEYLDTKGVTAPGPENFKGYAPESENEIKALKAIAQSRNFDCYISYHMKGNIIYYDDDFVEPEISALSELVAVTVSRTNGYRPYNLKTTNASGITTMGGFTDWVQVILKKPGITVECGTKCGPAGQGQAKSIFKKNRDTWISMARLFF